MSHARASDGANGPSTLAEDADEIHASNGTDARATSSAIERTTGDGREVGHESWEVVSGKKSSKTSGKTSAESAGTSEDGKKRRNSGSGSRAGGAQRADKVNAGKGSPPDVQAASGEASSGGAEPSGWAAIVTGRLSPSEVPASSVVSSETTGTPAVERLNLSREKDEAMREVAAQDDSTDGSPRTARETHIIDGARENAQAVGAGAKALRGWASILGGSSGFPEENPRSKSPNATQETAVAATEVAHEPTKATAAPSAPAWGGWGAQAPPKVDLKATMEEDAAAAAAAPPPPPPSKKESKKTEDKPGKQNGRKKDSKKDKSSSKQRQQDTYRKDNNKPVRSSVPVTKVSEPSVDASADRPRAPMTSEVEDLLVAKLGSELLDCAHMQFFTPTAHLLKKERRAVDIVIRAMSAIVQTLFPATGLDVFGSYPTRAWVPGSSNLDLSLDLPPEAMIASHPERRMEALNTLAMALRTNPWVLDVTVVPSSHRPLLRMTTHTAFFQAMPQQLPSKTSASIAAAIAAVTPPPVTSGDGTPPLPPGPRPGAPPFGIPGLGQNGLGLPLEVHISLKDANHKGLSAMQFVQAAEEQHGALAPLVCVQKAVLASKGLRGVYRGGLGSYALTLMALTAIQLRNSQESETEDETVVRVSTSKDEAKKSDEDEANSRDALILGRAMLNFLKLYGFETDLSKDIISVHSGGDGVWGVLSEAAQFPAPLGSGLRVKDPLDGSNNAGAGCFGIAGVQAVFREQLETLRKAAENGFESNVPLLMQLFTLGGSQKVFVV